MCLAIALCAASAASAQPRGQLGNYLAAPGFRWACDRLAHIEFCHVKDLPPAVAADTGRDAERALAEELHWAGATAYAPRIHLFLVESPARLRQLVGSYAFGSSEPTEHIVCAVQGHPETLIHELNHEIMTQLWGPSEPWIAEGLAAYVSAPGQVDGQIRQLLIERRIFPLKWLVNAQWTAGLPAFPSTIIYPELGSFVKYLRSTFGMARLRDVWRGGSKAIPRVLGKSLPDLELAWRASLTRP
jgi:hypothetical protein